MEFEYNGKLWAQKDNGPKMDVTRVSTLLDTLSTERSSDIVSPAPPVSSQTLTVSIGDEKNPTKMHFLIYDVKEKHYAKDLNQSANEAYVIGPNEKNAFPLSADSWKVNK